MAASNYGRVGDDWYDAGNVKGGTWGLNGTMLDLKGNQVGQQGRLNEPWNYPSYSMPTTAPAPQAGYSPTKGPASLAVYDGVATPQPANIDMSQSLYGKALAQKAAAASPLQAATAQAPAAIDAYGELIKQQQQAVADMKSRVTSQANPYDPNSPEFQSMMANARDRLTRQNNQVEARQAGSLAPQSDGLRAALANSTSNDLMARVADTQTNMLAGERDRAAQFEDGRTNNLLRLNAGDYGGVGSSLQWLTNLGVGQANEDRNYDIRKTASDLDNAYASGTLDSRIKLVDVQTQDAIREAGARAQLGPKEIEAKLQQLEAAKQQGREQAWLSENSWWLGPLKAAVNIGTSLAGGGFLPVAGGESSGPSAPANSASGGTGPYYGMA